MAVETPAEKTATPLPTLSSAIVPFGVNEVRLNARQWLIALIIIGLVAILVPRIWERLERFDTGPDYRISYQLSKDYWLYGRRMREVAAPDKIILLGDSVIWGEYVSPDGTLAHFLNQEARASDRFINGGLNGLFPLAQEGLIESYSRALRRQKLIVHFNPLWLTSPKADLSTDKEEQFNHSRLVPQFFPRIPCYRADANERLSAVIECHVNFLSWVDHLQNAYFGQKSILRWTLEDDGGDPPHYPNACKNPLFQISLRVPSDPPEDPLRGRASPRHRPWSETGQGTAQFDWVALDASLQWHAFQKVIGILRHRSNDVFVIVGPFNEHIMAEENRLASRKVRDGAAAWLAQEQIPHLMPDVLNSSLYADASHPLTEGYEVLAKRLFENEQFRKFLANSNASRRGTD